MSHKEKEVVEIFIHKLSKVIRGLSEKAICSINSRCRVLAEFNKNAYIKNGNDIVGSETIT